MMMSDVIPMIGTKTKQLILGFLSSNGIKEFSVKDMHEHLNIPESTLSKNLDELRKTGVLNARKEGKFKYYSMNKSFVPIFRDSFSSLKKVTSNLNRKKTKGAAVVLLSIFFAFTFFVTFSAVEAAGIPRTLNIQGKLTNTTTGAALSGLYNLTFRIYGQPSGGASLWTESQELHAVQGVYDAILGLSNPLTLNFSANYYLSIEVNSSGEMTPRVNITSTPYTYRSITSENLSCTNCVALTEETTGNYVADVSSGNGIAVTGVQGEGWTATVAIKLYTGSGLLSDSTGLSLNRSCMDGQILKWDNINSVWNCSDDSGIGSESDTLQTVTNRGPSTTLALTIDSNGDEQTSIGGNLTVDSGTLFIDSALHRVGIGTSSPLNKLNVRTVGDSTDTTIQIDSGASGSSVSNSSIKFMEYAAGNYDYGFAIGYDTGSNRLAIDSIDGGTKTSRMVIRRNNGNVGIGTTNPLTKLHVNGTVSVNQKLYVNNTVSIYNESSTTNQAVDLLTIQADSSGSVAAGFGTGIRLCNERVSGGTACVELETIQEATSGEAFMINVSETSSTNFYIDPAGFIGIGTENPENTFDVRNTAGSSSLAVVGSDNQNATIKLLESTEPVNDYGGLLKYYGATGPGNVFQIGTIDNNIEYPVIYIPRGSSNVGIGFRSPQNRLNINGTVNATDFICDGGGCINAAELNSDVAGLGINTTSGVLAVNIASPGGGVVVANDAVVLNQSCSDTQILKWNNAAGQWLCADDAQGTGGGGGWTVSGTYVYNNTANVNVGIGINNPATKLAVNASSNQFAIIDGDGTPQEWRFTANSDMLYIEDENTGAIPFKIEDGADTDTLLIDDSGHVGVGTTSPNQRLTVNGSANITGTLYADNVSSNSPLQLQTGGTTRVYINDTNGNVGIGTTSPEDKLEVRGDLQISEASNPRLYIRDTSASANEGEYFFQSSAGIFSGYAMNDARTGVDQWLGVNRTGATIDKVYFPNGNIGIGTSSPGAKLDVATGGTAAHSNTAIIIPEDSMIQGGGSPTSRTSFVQFTAEAGSNAGYGGWLSWNGYWNGTSWKQPRGSLSSLMYSSNYHLGWTWRYAANGGVDGGPITPTEVAKLTTTGNFQIDGDLTVSGGTVTGGNGEAIDLGVSQDNYIKVSANSAGYFQLDTNIQDILTAGKDLKLNAWSNSADQKIYLYNSESTYKADAYVEDTLTVGKLTDPSTIYSTSPMFASATPQVEIKTPGSSGTYQDLVVIRSQSIDADAELRRIGLLFKLSSESNENECNKTGGIVLDSSAAWGNSPSVSIVRKNTKVIEAQGDGDVVITLGV